MCLSSDSFFLLLHPRKGGGIDSRRVGPVCFQSKSTGLRARPLTKSPFDPILKHRFSILYCIY